MSQQRSNSAALRDVRYHLHHQTNARGLEATGPSIIERGVGSFVFDAQGKRLLEGMAGLWCTSLGFSETRLIEAAARQMRELPYYQDFRGASNYPLIDLAEMLIAKAPNDLSKVIFQSSGSEANETAFKLAWYYFNMIGKPEKKKIISRWSGYHGTTIAAGSATGLPIMHRAFDLPIDRFLKTDSPNFYRYGLEGESEEAFADRRAAELEALILAEGPETVAAFIAEPVMASAGVILPPKGYFEKVQAVLRRHGILFIVDEVVCGFGRTGSYWGSQTYGLQPDILTCAKALTGGYFPLSATLISAEIYEAIKRAGDDIGVFAHGFTYGAHPVGAAVAREALRIYDEMEIVSVVSGKAPLVEKRMRGLAGHPLVGEARHVGLCGALEIVSDKKSKRPFPPEAAATTTIVDIARQKGLVVRPIGESIAFAPPLIVNEGELGMLFDILHSALDDFLAQAAAKGQWTEPRAEALY